MSTGESYDELDDDDTAVELGYHPNYHVAPDSWTCPHCGALTTRPLVHDLGLHNT